MLRTLARRAEGASERDGARPCDRGDGGARSEAPQPSEIGDRRPTSRRATKL